MSRKGNCWDNSVAESFFHTLKTELFHHCQYRTREEARQGLRELRRQRIELAEWYGGLRNSSAKAWGSVKQGFAEAYTALQDAWREAADAYD